MLHTTRTQLHGYQYRHSNHASLLIGYHWHAFGAILSSLIPSLVAICSSAAIALSLMNLCLSWQGYGQWQVQ